MIKKYFATLAGFLMIAVIGFSGAVGAQATGSIPAPEATPQTCDPDVPGGTVSGGITIPDNKYDYFIVGGPQTPEDPGFYELDPGKYEVLVFTKHAPKKFKLEIDEAGDCRVEVTPLAPTFTHPDCDDLGTYEPATEPEGVEYDPAEGGELEHGESVTITASLLDGYKWTEDAVESWTFTAVRNPCDGEDGSDGSDGQDGSDGSDGSDGQDGSDGDDGEDGEVVVVTEVVEVPTRINTGR